MSSQKTARIRHVPSTPTWRTSGCSSDSMAWHGSAPRAAEAACAERALCQHWAPRAGQCGVSHLEGVKLALHLKIELIGLGGRFADRKRVHHERRRVPPHWRCTWLRGRPATTVGRQLRRPAAAPRRGRLQARPPTCRVGHPQGAPENGLVQTIQHLVHLHPPRRVASAFVLWARAARRAHERQ